jgi:hypothetical protein
VANKDFVVKNSLIVGSTVTINGIELDLTSITNGQVLKFDGTKIVPTDAENIIPSEISSYSQTIGNGTDTEYLISHNLGTKDLAVFAYSYTEDATPMLTNLEFSWQATDNNQITIIFENAPASDAVDVLIFSAGEQVYFSEIIGDGSSSSIELNHNLGSRDVVVTVRNINSPYEVVQVDAHAFSSQKVILDFSSPPANDSLVASVFLPLNGYYYGQLIGDGSSKNININHKLNTTDVSLISRDTGGLFDFPKVAYSIVDSNNIVVHYSSPPGNNDRYATVYAGLGGKREVPSFDDISVDVPLTPSSPGKYGDMAWDEEYIYICIATDTWKRSALSTWS